MSLPSPNLATLAGLPSLPLNGIPFPAPGRILSTIISFLLPTTQETWAIYDQSGNIAIQPDSFLEYGFNGGSSLCKFPVQDGAFADYNKVQHPDEVVVFLAKGGLDEGGRNAFIFSLNAMKTSLELFTVITPYSVDSHVNLYDYNYQHTIDRGSHMVIAELRFQEIRQVSAAYTNVTQAATTNAKSPSATPTTSLGNVAPVTPPSVLNDVANAAKTFAKNVLGL